ncbi:unnamed protein product [Didymodactylos carnosus]|uniref:NHL repeat-containing protein n=1 Tax=Didymodactylos carnosus TaxID=1234261 RepID=A0A814ZRT6_9BILA|nr:unnamed protein product [Didymodactylos carnosus]CAF4014550.1 unnamed protein product [Didymodactylos carnosus]
MSDGTGGTLLNQLSQPEDLEIDQYQNLYIADTVNNRIDYVVVAGGNGYGSNQNQFNQPSGVYVDERTLTVYIADTYNNRIQKWLENSTTGITVAGIEDTSSGTQTNRLKYPMSGLIVDREGNLYISDTNNQRIQQRLVNATEGRTMVGSEDGIGSADSNKLNRPKGIRFDWQYSLYVTDSGNNRVQKFNLIDNG